MEFFYSNFGRFFSFAVLTALEILLGIFLLFYGSEPLKFFAIFLLAIQIISLQKLYFFMLYLGGSLRV